MSKQRKLLAIGGGAALLIIVVFVIAQGMHHQARANQSVPSVVRSRSASTTEIPAVTPPESNPAEPSRKLNVADAVSAAALAMSNLSQAQFLPAKQMNQVVWATVVPSERHKFAVVYQQTGTIFATKYLGYTSVSDARLRSEYYVRTQKYRVASFGKQQAVIWLYTVSHWISGQNLETFTPSITIVQLRWQKGRWLFAGSHSPPASKIPAAKTGLSYEQTVQRFKPYLGGFKSYESA